MRTALSLLMAVGLVGAGFATAGAQASPAAPTGAAQVAAAGAQPSPHRSAPDYDPPPIDWGECPTASLRNAGAECGMLTVPLDYSDPDGTTIQLAVSRIEHTTPDSDAQGAMLVNPGGPGGSGLGLARLGANVPNGGGAPYDWIGFDPRGVGRSVPQLACDDDYFAAGARPPYDPSQTRTWLARTASYASDCDKAGGALLDHDKTTDWVQDMESIRKALGEQKINFYGFSYGTYLGQVYASLYPDRVRRFVFDGVVDPRDVWYEGNLAQERQFDPNIDTFFDWIADHDDAYGLGTDGTAVRQVYYDVLDQLTDDPEPNFGAPDWNDIFTGAAYYVYDWDTIAHVLVAASQGDLGPAKAYYGDPTGPGSDNTYATYMAVECTDAQWPNWKTQQRDATKLAADYPFLTWNNTFYNAPCLTWGADAASPVRVNGKKVPPILLIEETNDAATPWSGAIEVRKRFPKSALIEGVGGTTHAGSLSGVACTDDRIADYLLTGKMPTRVHGQNRSDVQCDPVPPPEATPVATRKTAPSMSAQSRDDNLGKLRDLITDAAPAVR